MQALLVALREVWQGVIALKTLSNLALYPVVLRASQEALKGRLVSDLQVREALKVSKEV